MAAKRWEVWGEEPNGSVIESWKPWFRVTSPTQCAKHFGAHGLDGEALVVMDLKTGEATRFVKTEGVWIRNSVTQYGTA